MDPTGLYKGNSLYRSEKVTSFFLFIPLLSPSIPFIFAAGHIGEWGRLDAGGFLSAKNKDNNGCVTLVWHHKGREEKKDERSLHESTYISNTMLDIWMKRRVGIMFWYIYIYMYIYMCVCGPLQVMVVQQRRPGHPFCLPEDSYPFFLSFFFVSLSSISLPFVHKKSCEMST